ncbi:hypothetical protein [Saliniramus sp.]|uniref:hypothetical protein n=1 Tax=Saliniramus sp. TaxID=2986772 RepID=UPI002C0B843E|nr:hypothetical protein [Saliniramus sp.]HMB11790.1 hypothetical protein [Saliniramus sp.]
MHDGKFSIGQQVHMIADRSNIVRVHPDQLERVFEIVRIVPGERDGELQYHLRSTTEPHMRAASESQLQAV